MLVEEMGGQATPQGDYIVLFSTHLEIWRKHFDIC